MSKDNKKKVKRTVSLSMDSELIEKAKEKAKTDGRSLSGYVSFLLRKDVG